MVSSEIKEARDNTARRNDYVVKESVTTRERSYDIKGVVMSVEAKFCEQKKEKVLKL